MSHFTQGPVADSPLTAWLEPDVTVKLLRCDGQWCRVAHNSMVGFVKQYRPVGGLSRRSVMSTDRTGSGKADRHWWCWSQSCGS